MNLKEYFIWLYEIACENWETQLILYRNRAYKWAFYMWKCYILNSKNELLDITDKNYKIIKKI